MKSKRRILIWTISVTLAIAIMVGVCAIYVSDYYRADNTAITSFTASHSVSPNENPDGIITFEPIDPIAGFTWPSRGYGLIWCWMRAVPSRRWNVTAAPIRLP